MDFEPLDILLRPGILRLTHRRMGGYAPVTRRLTEVKGVWTAGESLLENDLLDHHLLPVYHVYQVISMMRSMASG